jgi:RHS repeat-associated protein
VSVVDASGKTTSRAYGLGNTNGDSATYAISTGTDANGHVSVSFTDELGRTRYTQTDSGKVGGTLTPNEQTATQYNVLNLPTSITVKDLAPQSGQTITSVTTTAQYDDQGRETSIADPDRGTHTYSYNADGAMISDVSGTRTLGYSVDLLGRVGCVQDAIPTADVHGACSSGTNPFVKNTYDADPGGVTWTGSNYPVGHLTQSVAINYLPSPDNAQGTVTQNWQHDQRGRLITSRLNMAVTGGTLAFPTFPQYQQTQTYNDADQPMMMQTSVGGSAGYTTSQAYDGTTGTLTGLSNNSVGTANLATLTYNGQGLIGGMNYLSTSGTGAPPVATSTMSYDLVLRPTGSTTTWQSNGTTLFNDQITYDAIGNVLSRSATESAVTGQSGTGGNETQNFCYDEQNRLVWASNNTTVPSAGNGTCGNVGYQSTLGGNYTNQYAYTNLGQLWQGPKNGGSTQEQYLYCDSAHPHQLSNLSQTASTPTCASKGTVDYTGSYDSWGNTTSQVRDGITRTLKYDGLDHLVRWSSSVNSQQEWNLYDSSGERVLRRTYDGTNTVLTVFAFGVEEHAYSYSGSGSSDTNTGNTFYYTLAGQELGTWDGTSPGSPTTNFLLTDTLGSVVSSFNNLPNGAAVVLGDQVYGPYGNRRVQQGTISTSMGFTGQFTDFVAGLDYYGARYYDPVVGVFVSADVVQGNAQGMNPYGYVGGNPETWIDPTGHQMIEGGEGVGGDGAAAGDGAGVGDGGIGDVGGGSGGSSGGGTSDVTPSEYGNGVPTPTSIQGTANGVTAALNSDATSVTVFNADGSQTTLYPDSPGYSEALDAAVSGSGSTDETAHGATNPLDNGSAGGTTATVPTNEPPTATGGNEPAVTSAPETTRGNSFDPHYEDKVKAAVGDPTVGEPNSHRWDGSMPATDALHNPIPKDWDGPDAIEMWGTPDERWIEAKQTEPEEMLFEKEKNVRQLQKYQYFGRPFTYYMSNMPDQSTLDFIIQAGGDYVIFP